MEKSRKLAKLSEILVARTVRQISYVFTYKKNMEVLKREIAKLADVKARMQHSVVEAKRQGEEIERDVERWMVCVDQLMNEVEQLMYDDEGLCPNLKTRYFLSKKAVRITNNVAKLAHEVFHSISVSHPIPPLHVKGPEQFKSRERILREIMETLNDPNVNMIGVHGTAGVGKTVLVKNAAVQAIENMLFDELVWIAVTQAPDIKRIQVAIADQLGLLLREETETERAGKLLERLKMGKRVLVVLDDIWEKLDLQAVGIPLEETNTQQDDDRKSCTVLLTSRSLSVCHSMNTHKNILVEPLNDGEAYDFFWSIVGDLEKNSHFEPIAAEIVRKCAGLPITILTVANSLKFKSLHQWKNTLQLLRNMDDPVYLRYKLLNDEQKSLFVLCGLFDACHPIPIRSLLSYGMGLGLFENVDTLEKGWSRVYNLIHSLKASPSPLLSDGDTSDTVKMDQTVHAVAVSVASLDELMFNVQIASDLKELLEKKEIPQDATAISLPYGDDYELPERLEFPKLKLLSFYAKHLSLQLSDLFFKGMKELNVLDLSGTHFPLLPSSLRYLKKLQTLCLDKCQLGDIAVIGELEQLEILSFSHSDIEQLPEQIGQLTQLKVLDLSNCLKLERITAHVISRLSRLEELYMDNTFVQWDVEGLNNNASPYELKQLSHLTTLNIHVQDAQIMPRDLFFEKLKKYRICIGDVWSWCGRSETSRMLKLKLSNNVYLWYAVKKLLKRAEDLYLDEVSGVKNVLYELDGEGFSQLKYLHVQNGPEFLYIVNSVDWYPCKAFPVLKSLFLDNLINLERICHGQLEAGSFKNLRIIKVGKCDKLMRLLSFSMAKSVLGLEEIEVTNCKNLKEIVGKESEDCVKKNGSISKIAFVNLRLLTLQYLPLLASFGFNVETPSTSQASTNTISIEIMAEDECEDFMPVNQNVLFPKLEKLIVSSINIKSIRFNQDLVLHSCSQTLTSLIIEKCDGLKYLFSSSMVQSLVQLQNLEIRNCGSMEVVIDTEGFGEGGSIYNIFFPKLFHLELKDLPKLTRFCSFTGNLIVLSSLSTLSIDNCPNMESFISNSISANIKESKELEETNLKAKIVFPQLASLRLAMLPIFTSFYPGIHILEWPVSKELVVRRCDKLKIFSSEFLSLQETHGENQHEISIQQPLSLANKEILSCEELHDERRAEALSQLSHLNRSKRLESLNTRKENSRHSKVFQNLITLEVSECCKLKLLVPSSVSFQNLTTLEVSKCDGLINLLTTSTAKSLVQLTRMNITDCELIEEIITDMGDHEENDLIVFSQLKYLRLHHLPSLTSFFSGNYTLEFPSLEQVIVRQCPKMKTFSHGNLSTPQLHNVQLTEAEDEVFYEDSLNITIQKLFKKMNVDCSSKD